MKKVIIRKFEEKKLDETIKRGFAEFGVDKKLPKLKTVFIKPNLVTDIKEYINQGANTDIRIIEAVIKYLSNFKNLKIFLGESETGTKVKGRKLDLALDLMGIKKLQKKYKFEIVNLTYDKKIKVKIPGAKVLKEIEMAKTLMDTDLIINLPKIKTHKYATITCALKNMFGTIPDPMRIIYHQNIHQVLADLFILWKNKMFVITDGIVGMEGAGPLFGTGVKLGILLFADNSLFNDVVATRIMQIPLQKVKHILLVNEIEKENLENIKIDGDIDINSFKYPFKMSSKSLFVKMEGELMKHPLIVSITFTDWFKKNISKRLSPLLLKLRGGSYQWYE